MSDVDAVVDLLERWRDASGSARLRIGIDATRTIGGLPVARKRALAIEVAERVAPQLVPAIQSEEGDLSSQQVGAVVDLLRRADRQQLDQLIDALRSGDVMEAIDLVDEAVAVAAPPDTDTPLDGPAMADEHFNAEDMSDEAATDGTASASDEATDAAAAGGDSVAVGEDGDDGELRVDAEVAAALADDEVEISADGKIELDEAAVRARLEAEAAARTEALRDTSRDVPAVPAYRAPVLDFISDSSDFELPDPTVEEVAPLASAIAPSRQSGELSASPVSATVASITATPDGYRRRRVALASVREERLQARDVAAVVRSFERGTDRSWVAGAALDAGIIGEAELEGLGLSSAAIGRLRRRVH